MRSQLTSTYHQDIGCKASKQHLRRFNLLTNMLENKKAKQGDLQI